MDTTSREMSTTPDETLKGLLESAKGTRLSVADEEQALAVLKQTLGEGKKGLAVSLEALTILPWSLGVKAVTEAWPELKPTTRRQFLAALAKLDSDQGKRMRLSIARGLFPIEQPVALKLILGFCSELDPAEGKDRQHFTNVLIGKTKPWILNIPLTGLKPAETTALLKFTLAASQQTPAFTQIWILGWLAQAGLLEKLNEEQITTIATAAKRWQPRWQKELQKTVPALPAPIEEAIKSAPPEPQQSQKPAQASKKSGRSEKPERKQGERPAQTQNSHASQNSHGPSEPTQEPEGAQETTASEWQPKASAPAEQKPQPHQSQNRQQPQRGGTQQQGQQRERERERGPASFDLQRNLGEIQSYINSLKAEIQQLKGQMRQREPRRAEQKERELPTSEELETLRRHNAQLEDTAAQLRRDIEELISDHEDRASTLGSSDEIQQFKALLGVKLGKDYFDFEALRRESATEVVRRHLGDLLSHIFEVLKTEGVEFQDQN